MKFFSVLSLMTSLIASITSSAIADPIVNAKGRTTTYAARVVYQRTSEVEITLKDYEIPWGVKVFLELGYFGRRSQVPFQWEQREGRQMESTGPFEWKASVDKVIEDHERKEKFDAIDFYFRVVHADGHEEIIVGTNPNAHYRCFFPTPGFLSTPEDREIKAVWTNIDVQTIIVDRPYHPICPTYLLHRPKA
jgi:hypothetical protein